MNSKIRISEIINLKTFFKLKYYPDFRKPLKRKTLKKSFFSIENNQSKINSKIQIHFIELFSTVILSFSFALR